MTPPVATQALIIGAGPVGLFQAFELGLLGITSHIVDALPYAGGQCIEIDMLKKASAYFASLHK